MPLPTASELNARLALRGEVALSGPEADRRIRSALLSWESAVGYSPFVSEGSAIRTVEHPGGDSGRLYLPAPVLSVTQVAIDGVILTGWRLAPFVNRGPSLYVEFPGMRLYPGRYDVTGVYGWSADWPADAFDAILGRAAESVATQGGFVTSEKIGSASVTYSEAHEQSTFTAASNKYRIPPVV